MFESRASPDVDQEADNPQRNRSSMLGATSLQRTDRRPIIAIIVVIAVLSVTFALLLILADKYSPWPFRIAVVLVITLLCYRIGQVISRSSTKTRTWLPAALGTAGAVVSIYFGAVRPAIHDRNRDHTFAALMAEGQTVADQLNSVARDTPEPENAKSITPELAQRNVEVLQRAIDWMKRYHDEFDKLTSHQRRELHEQFHLVNAASKAAREKLERLPHKTKKQ